VRALHHTQSVYQQNEGQDSLYKNIFSRISELSELIWLCITFLLFIVMGPFSVIAVLYGLWALATGETKERMVEPASC